MTLSNKLLFITCLQETDIFIRNVTLLPVNPIYHIPFERDNLNQDRAHQADMFYEYLFLRNL